MSRRLRIFICLAVAIAVGFGAPLVERWMACATPDSEACVWAKAYLPLSFALWSVAGAFAAALVYVLLGRTARR